MTTMLCAVCVCVLLMTAVTGEPVPSPGGCGLTAEKFYTAWESVQNFTNFAEGVILKKVLVSAAEEHGISKRSASLTCALMSAYCQFLRLYYPKVYDKHRNCMGPVTCIVSS